MESSLPATSFGLMRLVYTGQQVLGLNNSEAAWQMKVNGPLWLSETFRKPMGIGSLAAMASSLKTLLAGVPLACYTCPAAA